MHRVSSLMFGLGLALVAATTLSAQNPGGSAEGKAMKNPVAANADSIAAGQALFAKNCRFCHGDAAKGNGPMAPKGTNPPDLTDAKWDHGATDGEIFTNIRDGIAPKYDMKPNKGKISDEDIWNIVNYLRSIGPKQK